MSTSDELVKRNGFVNPLPGVPDVESPFFDDIFASKAIDAETLRVARELNERGYAVIDFPDPGIDERVERIKADLGPRYDWDNWRKEGWRNNQGLRIQDASTFNTDVAAIASNVNILRLLQTLYGRRCFPFQTLNFPVGTQQPRHTDSVHFSSVPERFMCGVWLAMEDIDEGNGALNYYPGSHRLPIYVNEHIGVCSAELAQPRSHYVDFERMWAGLVRVHRLPNEVFRARKGQALIWAANLLHGGGAHVDPSRTRWSQVTHYFFDDCVYYTPMLSDPIYGSVFYRNVTDISTGERVPNKYGGHPVSVQLMAKASPRQEWWRTPDASGPTGFDAAAYLLANPDVAAAGMNAAKHYRQFGKREGRRLRP